MRLSLNWVSDHVDLSGLDPAQVAHDLTMATALIEGVSDQAAALAGVVVGRVLECGPHPGADRLSLCRVDHGGGEPAQVVCGAPNVAVGQSILYAPVGVTLPSGVKLKKAKIRGESSEGMICAEDELGLGPEHDGILLLPAELEPGRPVSQVAGLCDVVLEIDNKSVTHRPDLWGHYGFARELAAIYRRDLKPLSLDASLGPGDFGPAIEVQDANGCPRYLGLALEGVSGVTPDRLRFRLAACGMRPLSLLVDLSNYVMLETGQPTHPFDRDTLAGDRIVVRRAVAGERLVTLDGLDRALHPEDLVIADGKGVVALAGLMGGAPTEVSAGTRRLLLESAVFDPNSVRRSAGRHALRTEAVARFEKGLDPALAELAVRRFARLLAEIDPGAQVSTGFRAVGDAAAPRRTLPLSLPLLSSRLGLNVLESEVVAVLGSTGFEPKRVSEGQFEVTVPSFRATRDVTGAEDLVEEVGRLLGYDRVPTPTPVGPLIVGNRDPVLLVEERLRDGLAGAAGTEVFSYSTLPDDVFETLGLPVSADHPRLVNALQKDAQRLRPSVAPSLLRHLEAWLRHEPEVITFEVGKAYAAAADGSPVERSELAVLVARRDVREERDVFRQLKGVLELALQELGCPAPKFVSVSPGGQECWLHPGRTAQVEIGGREVGHCGSFAPGLAARLGAPEARGAIAVLDVEALAECERGASNYRAVSRFPGSRIDLAFLVDYGVSCDAIEEAICAAGPKTLIAVDAFDVFRRSDDRSLGFRLQFQADDRTLTDKELTKARDRIVQAVEALGARLR